MKNSHLNFKITLGTIYLFILFAGLYLLFTNFDYKDFTNFLLIKEKAIFLEQLVDNNYILLAFFFFLFSIVWTLLFGFGSPLAIFSGFIFGKWVGSIILVLGLSIGSFFLYLLAKYFFQDLVKELFYKKFEKLLFKFEKNEFIIFLIYRLIGGIPFGIANVLPVLFNIKLRNYFFGTFIGILPSIFVLVSFGDGIENIVTTNTKMPTLFELVKDPGISFPILGFLLILISVFFLKKYFNKV
tara:strand:+ start:125 stop:847 length:723 start_codon:yes stop_codon:yes gene_type:complete